MVLDLLVISESGLPGRESSMDLSRKKDNDIYCEVEDGDLEP